MEHLEKSAIDGGIATRNFYFLTPLPSDEYLRGVPCSVGFELRRDWSREQESRVQAWALKSEENYQKYLQMI